MAGQAFKVDGDFQMGRVRQHFSVEVVADGPEAAREHMLADLGSRHGAKRRDISIHSITPIDAADVEGAVTRKRMQG